MPLASQRLVGALDVYSMHATPEECIFDVKRTTPEFSGVNPFGFRNVSVTYIDRQFTAQQNHFLPQQATTLPR